MKTALKALLVLGLALPGLARAAAPVLSPQGYGAVRFGMPLAAAEKALGQRIRERRSDAPCRYVTFRQYPGIRFMVEEGRAVRADTGKSLPNSAGARIGMDMAQIQARHPQQDWTVQGRNEDSVTYAHKLQDPDRALVLYTEDGKVRYLWAGIAPAYGYYEGCL